MRSLPDEAASHAARQDQQIPVGLRTLYLVQLLSSWGIRSSESSQVLFLAAAYPGTLFYVSVYGLVKSLAAVVFSSWVGAYADSFDRLSAMHLSIAFQRCSVALSCILFLLLPWFAAFPLAIHIIFVALVVLACLEKLASVVNVVAIERDWVIIIAEASSVQRQHLNASLRRLDLLTKLASPLLISLLDTLSPWLALWAVLVLNLASIFAEFNATRRIYNSFPDLSIRAPTSKQISLDCETEIRTASPSHFEAFDAITLSKSHSFGTWFEWLSSAVTPWNDYIRSSVFLASFSNSILYWTVLSFGGQMTTYLLNTGFSPLNISFLRVASVFAELGGTWIAPILMDRIGPVRAGLWFLMWQVACVGIFANSIFSQEIISKKAGMLLTAGITFKRLGLWGSDLSIQFIVQEATPPLSRAQFSSTEMASQNLFEMLSSATTAIFSQPDEFRYPIMISYAAIVASALCYAGFVSKVRGHLVHLPSLGNIGLQ